jgi:hypothetical protein
MRSNSKNDPIFDAIKIHQNLVRVADGLYDKLNRAEFRARKKHGSRPWPLIAWRNYGAIGGHEIDNRRDEFLHQPGANRKQIEKEYRDAKAREAAAESAGIEWDMRAGITELRDEYERAERAQHSAVMKMVRTKPTTPAGVAALITVTRRDIGAGDTEWHVAALKTAASACSALGD